MNKNLRIGIIDYGAGNVSSVFNIIKKIGGNPEFCKIPDDSNNYKLFILPGVGSFDYAMERLNQIGWVERLQKHLEEGGYLMGICLGMQVLCESSEEGKQKGLNLIPGCFVRINDHKGKYKVPHMGWNNVNYSSEVFSFGRIDEKPRYYFVHSYRYFHSNNNYVLGTTDYVEEFPSVIGSDDNKIIGVQFHPEKSHRYGMEFFKNYLESIKV